ncbi:MAG: Gldg family protein [Candidatus Cryptobacteroides sp.]
MRSILRILKTELKVFFYSPIAWLILLVFAVQAGAAFCGLYSDGLRYQEMGYPVRGATAELISGTRGLFVQMLGHLYLYIPLLTMGLMSREYANGSVKLLYSSPVSNFQIIVGKYLSTMVYGLVLVLVLCLPAIFTCMYVQEPDIMMIVVAAFGVYITICAYSAIGLFLSTITQYQVVAVISTLIVLAILNFIGNVGQEYDFVRDVTFWLSISGRSKVFLQGMICTREVLYFILVIFLFLSMSIIMLRGRRLKLPVWKTSLNYAAVLVVVFGLGLLSSNPKFIKYYDATEARTNTLTEYSQDVMSKITDGLTITTYANVLDETWYHAEPRNKNFDIQRFEKYVRFKPEIKQEYVYYYGDYYSNYRYERDDYKDKTPYELVHAIYRWSRQDTTTYIPQEQVWEVDDIREEGGRMVRVLTRENGRKAVLRIFEDSNIYPSETEITAAMKTLVGRAAVPAFVTGHGERSIYDNGDKGYGSITTYRVARHTLINQGFAPREINLSTPIPIDVDFLVISDVKSPFSDAEMENYQKFIDRGGNVLILGEPRRQQFMNPLVEPFGLKFADNLLVSPNDLFADDVIIADVSRTSEVLSPSFAALASRGYKAVMNSACAVERLPDSHGFNVEDIMLTSETGVWLETTTRDFANEKSVLNPAAGEVERQYSVASVASRKHNGKDQIVIVTGDSDMFSPKELSASRAGVAAANFSWFSEFMYAMTGGEYPVNVGRLPSPDNRYTASHEALPWMKFIYEWLVPALILLAALIVLVRRKRR